MYRGLRHYTPVGLPGRITFGFRTRLHDFVSDLHVRYATALRDYTGDPATLPDLPLQLDRLVVDLTKRADQKPSSLIGRRAKIAAGLIGLLLIGVACFYVQFTINLLPVAFPGPTPTPTATLPAASP